MPLSTNDMALVPIDWHALTQSPQSMQSSFLFLSKYLSGISILYALAKLLMYSLLGDLKSSISITSFLILTISSVVVVTSMPSLIGYTQAETILLLFPSFTSTKHNL